MAWLNILNRIRYELQFTVFEFIYQILSIEQSSISDNEHNPHKTKNRVDLHVHSTHSGDNSVLLKLIKLPYFRTKVSSSDVIEMDHIWTRLVYRSLLTG